MKPSDYPSKPAHLWEHFYQFTQIARPSKHEERIRQYIIDQAEALDCDWRMDDTGNLVVLVDGTKGRASDEPLIVQNHIDMVTVKTRDKDHDFFKDPLQLKVEDGWLMADRTTLGADNGVGCAAALALMTDPKVEHPPLELLFTVDEETGLGGALGLDPSLLTGSRLLNLDTEDWNELYVGCAGGGGWTFRREFHSFTIADMGDEWSYWTLSLNGLAGGHSGIQIHQQLGNALKILAYVLSSLDDIRLAEFSGGVAHNVIPREGSVTFACSGADSERLVSLLPELTEELLTFLPEADAQLALTLTPLDSLESVIDANDSHLILDLIAAMPHGAQAYNFQHPAELVDLSSNVAKLSLSEGHLSLVLSYRFFNDLQVGPLRQSILGIARQFGLTGCERDGYPGWQPVFDSPLLALGKETHEELFDCQPAIKAIHAGLECGILKNKKPDVDMLSFGPTIRGAHSPTERLEIKTVLPFWQYLTALVAKL